LRPNPNPNPVQRLARAATARCFASKLGIQSDRVLNAVMNDRMIAKGLVLHWATAFFVDFLATEPMDDLVAILRKARPATRPPRRQSPT